MKHLIMGTAGHVDHGKTSLIKALTNIDCDTHKEEKKRGITINLGFSHLDLPSGESIGIIDVPGHKDFINTMVGGACGIDFVLLVIAADSGIMPQTIEHLNIIEVLGVKKGIIALTKTDLVDEELAEVAKLEILELLEGTSLENAPIVGVSSETKDGIPELIETISGIISNVEEKESKDLFRMYIDRMFNVKGFGSVVTGSVLSGNIKTGQDVYLLPGNFGKCRIRNMERHGKTTEEVIAGDRAAINLMGVKQFDLQRGQILSAKELDSVTMVDAHISLFDNAASIGIWSTVIFHAGTFECQARMHLLNKDNVNAGETGIVQLHLEKPTVLLNRDKFVIRNSSSDKTYGGGIIIDAVPLHHRKRTPQLIESLELLVKGSLSENNISDQIKIELLKEKRPLSDDELSEKLNKQKSEITQTISEITDETILKYSNNSILVDASVEAKIIDKILEELKAFNEKHYIFQSGMENNELYGKFSFSKSKAGKPYIDLLLEKMHGQNQIESYKNTWTSKGHQAKVDDKTKEQISFVEKVVKDYLLQRPVMSEIEEAAIEKKITKDNLKMFLFYLAENDKVVQHEGEVVHVDNLNPIREKLIRELAPKPEGIDGREFRQLADITKRFIPVLASIFESEKIVKVEKVEFGIHLHITEKGKKLYESLS